MLTNLELALKSLTHNRLQAGLTLCGMSIGVAMVVFVSGLGLGAQQQIETQIESAGPTLITVRSGNFRPLGITMAGQQDSSGGELAEGFADEAGYGDRSYEENAAMIASRQRAINSKVSKVRSPAWPLRPDEMALLSQSIRDVRATAGSVSGNITVDSSPVNPVRIVKVYGFESAWPEMKGWKLIEGRLLTEREHLQAASLTVIPVEVAERYWPNESALQKSFALGGETFEIVGVVRTGEDMTNSLIVPTIFIPLEKAQHLLDQYTFDEINLRSVSVGKTTEVANNIRAALRDLRKLPKDTMDDFRVETQSLNAMPSLGADPRIARAVHANIIGFEQASWEQMAISLRQAGRTFTYLLSGAAAVSLLVGGIGVMNIMLVSVTARTREIGLRMALGARMHDVLAQFMVEAIALAALGGMAGLVLGVIGLYVAQNLLHWATAVSPVMLLIAIFIAAATGFIFGFGPARRAASLDPVVALKSE